jgi:hypothetical protein
MARSDCHREIHLASWYKRTDDLPRHPRERPELEFDARIFLRISGRHFERGVSPVSHLALVDGSINVEDVKRVASASLRAEKRRTAPKKQL